MCMDVLPACMSMYHMHAWYLQRLGVQSSGTEVMDCCETKLGWMVKQSILLTAKPFLWHNVTSTATGIKDNQNTCKIKGGMSSNVIILKPTMYANLIITLLLGTGLLCRPLNSESHCAYLQVLRLKA